MAEERLQRRLAAILSADVVGYSRLMGLDEAGTLSRLNALRRELIDPAIAAHSGRIVKLMGDGALVEFASAVDAVTCAIEIQRQLRERDAGGSEANPIQFRIGINVGDIIIEGEDILGDGVNIAARIESIAEPGGISISEDAWRQVHGKVAANFVDAGEQSLKNIARPVRVYRLDLSSEGRFGVGSAATGCADARQAFHRRPRLQQYEWRPRAGVFFRRHQRGHHHRSLEGVGAVRDRAQLELHLQGQAGRREAGRPRPRRALRAGGQRAQGGQSGPRDRPAHRRCERQRISGPTASIATSPISSPCRTNSHGRSLLRSRSS